jgi:hypothetical protein
MLPSYHDGHQEDWGKYLGAEVLGGRIVAVKLLPRSIDHSGTYLVALYGACATVF